jgi:thiamine phosphate synthase YjbQ (UPF0047 family)
MDTTELRIDTSGSSITDLSGRVADFCSGQGDGLLHVFAPHATVTIGDHDGPLVRAVPPLTCSFLVGLARFELATS